MNGAVSQCRLQIERELSMKEILHFNRELKSATLNFPELERHIGKIAEITITVENDFVCTLKNNERLMNYFPHFISASTPIDETQYKENNRDTE